MSTSSLTGLQEHALADQRHAGGLQPQHCGAGLPGQFARVFGVDGDIDGLACPSVSARVSAGVTRSRAATGRLKCRRSVYMPHGSQRGRRLGDAARRKRERIAAGQHDLPDLGCAQVVESGGEGGLVEPRFAGMDRFAAKNKTGNRPRRPRRAEQNPIGIAMHQSAQGTPGVIAMGSSFGRIANRFARVRQELPRDRVRGIAGSSAPPAPAAPPSIDGARPPPIPRRPAARGRPRSGPWHWSGCVRVGRTWEIL